jgi:hypothetical protein
MVILLMDEQLKCLSFFVLSDFRKKKHLSGWKAHMLHSFIVVKSSFSNEYEAFVE